ncbi:hypothetical protein EVAR_43552_1 [Eumeta japonica]|uniref:Mariner Mos1 transposase n=1 Tax=Eumeta variegata TaxID=151549 RepID=A0A4C1WAG4_EUMVA|nr:hypothetical protein EVAR_43552_1 [Eumeta japonica]
MFDNIGAQTFAFRDKALILCTLLNWFNEFKRGRTNLIDELCKGRPSMGTTEDDISAVRLMIETDKRVTYQHIRTSLGIAFWTRAYELAYSRWSPPPMDTRDSRGVTNTLPAL